MPEPRVGMENLLWFVRAYTVALTVGVLALVLIMGRRGLPLRQQKWWLAPFVGFNAALFMWFIGFDLFAAFVAGAIMFAATLVIFAGVGAIQRESAGGDRDARPRS
ncbi:MAG: hypothetical protein WBI91_02425 [Coriobacteriia bacterium]